MEPIINVLERLLVQIFIHINSAPNNWKFSSGENFMVELKYTAVPPAFLSGFVWTKWYSRSRKFLSGLFIRNSDSQMTSGLMEKVLTNSCESP